MISQERLVSLPFNCDFKIECAILGSSMPVFSIIIAVYNDWKVLDPCLRSLTPQRGGPDFEVIVVDDGSNEEAPAVIRQWVRCMPLTIVRQSHAGISAARNRVKPTVFSNVRNDMTIAREEIFGPVLCIIPYKDEEDAIRIANDTLYGLSGYVSSRDLEHARRVAKRIRSGNVHINGARVDFAGCFGGYKQSGNGREWSVAGLEEFLELKAVFGYTPVKK